MAEQLGVNKQTLMRWENGKIDPPALVWKYIEGLKPDREKV